MQSSLLNCEDAGFHDNSKESEHDGECENETKEVKFDFSDLSLETMSQLIIIYPNTFLFQVWIWLISLLGTVSALFYTWMAVVRDDLESWEHTEEDETNHHHEFLLEITQIAFYIEILFVI